MISPEELKEAIHLAAESARREEAAHWVEATRHTADCAVVVAANKPVCSCGSHATLADLHAQYAAKLRRKSFR